MYIFQTVSYFFASCVSAAIAKNNILHINKHQTGFDVDDDKRVVKTDDTATLDREH